MTDQYKDIITFLVDSFEEYLTKHNPGLVDVVSQEIDKTKAFVNYARNLLSDQRIQGIFPADDNYGLILGDGSRVMICVQGEAKFTDSIYNVDTSGSMCCGSPLKQVRY